ncbi:MAG: RNA polymerase subunit sigma [Hyphomicrobiales bacterium]|nr:MAG: RNA polymerase subunit sigma [Hyphomicrobiales bacterium]
MSGFLDQMTNAVPALRRYARGLCRDQELADDLVQDCVERAIRKQRLWKPTGSVQSWMFRMMLNIHRNQLKSGRNKLDSRSVEMLDIDMPQAPEQPGRLALTEVSNALAKIPDDQKQALLLVVLEGFSYADAAKILDIPVGTLMSRISRARSQLRSLTHEDGLPHLRVVT